MSITILLIFSFITSNCQTITDTWFTPSAKISPKGDDVIIDSCTCIPNKQLIRGAQLIEKGKRDALLLEQAQSQIQLLSGRIEVKELQIDQFKKDTLLYGLMIVNYQKEVENLKSQRDIAIDAAKTLDKQLRRQKRKTIIGIIASSGIAIAIAVLLK